jgi:hypothetical protein
VKPFIDIRQAYATDLHKDGPHGFAFKISGSKHSFDAQTTPERDGWYLAIEKAIAEAKEAKDGIESSEGYKEQKETIGTCAHFLSDRVPSRRVRKKSRAASDAGH